MAFEEYTWIFAVVTIAFAISSFANGANDIANSYSTTVAARSLTLLQVGILAGITEFIGAVFLGSRVTNTLKSNIIDISRFNNRPDVLMVVMMCAEMGSAAWLWFATSRGFSVSTTQTTVGAIIGAGIGAGIMPDFSWGRNSRITQTILTWTIAPAVSGVIAALIYAVVSSTITSTKRSLGWGIKLMPLYLAITTTIMGCFIMFERAHKESAESFAKIVLPVVLCSFCGMLVLSYVFWFPFIRQRLLHENTKIQFRHLILGPYLLVRNPRLPFAGEPRLQLVQDYTHGLDSENGDINLSVDPTKSVEVKSDLESGVNTSNSTLPKTVKVSTNSVESNNLSPELVDSNVEVESPAPGPITASQLTPEERWIYPYRHLPWYNGTKLCNIFRYCFLQGVSRDVVTVKEGNGQHQGSPSSPRAMASRELINKKEHLLTYAQVIAAIMTSIAHGSNDVSNAVGPWVTVWGIWNRFNPAAASGLLNESLPDEYKTTAIVSQKTPVWIFVAAALLMALGFWIRGWVIMSATGTKLVRQTPSRGFSVAMGTAVTVLVASRIGMPVSTTQCVIGSCVGVGFLGGGGMKIKRRTEPLSLADVETIERGMCSRNPYRQLKIFLHKRFEIQVNKETVNWRQVLKLFIGWVLTLPVAGLVSGFLATLFLRSPSL